MDRLRNSVLGFGLALLATMAVGAQSPPAHLTLVNGVFYVIVCIPEAVCAPLIFPLMLCYWGFGLFSQFLGAGGLPAFAGDPVQVIARACLIGLAFWTPSILHQAFPHVVEQEENEGLE